MQVPLQQALRAHLGTARVNALHTLKPHRHLLIASRQLALLGLLAWAITLFSEQVWLWLPAALLLGCVLFSFSVLLHEVVHHAAPPFFASELFLTQVRYVRQKALIGFGHVA